MGFSKMLELLQEKNKGYIILANAGAFYLARGKDAVKLNEILGLKLVCMEPEVCKIGIPVNSIETYMKKLEEKEYSYIVYYFNQQTNRLEIIKKYTGKYKNAETKEKKNCYICQNTVKVYKKPDKYIEAVEELYKEETEIEKEYRNNKKEKIQMDKKSEKENKLQLIPKAEKYIEYILQVIIKLPRTEKFSIGNEYKQSMYQMIRKIMYINKIGKGEKSQIIETLNHIDAELNTQRIYLRIMKKNKWIDEKKFKVAMEQIYEIGKILGGLIKYYAKNDTKQI